MQLIDKYCHLSAVKQPTLAQNQLNSSSLANQLKKRLQQKYGSQYTMAAVSDNEEFCLQHQTLIAMLTAQPNSLYDFQLFASFNFLLQTIQIRGQLTHNGVPMAVESLARITLALNMAANLNKLISPVFISLHPRTGMLALNASVFIEQAAKRNDEDINEMTHKIVYLITLVEENRDLLLFLLEEKLPPSSSFARRHPSLAQQFAEAEKLISTLEASLFSMNLDIFDRQGIINNELKRLQFNEKYEPLTEETQQAVSLFSENLRNVGKGYVKLSNEEYGEAEIELCKGELEREIGSQILTRAYLLDEQGWVFWQCLSSGGYGKIERAEVKVALRHACSPSAQVPLQIIRKSDKRKIKESRVVHEREIVKNLKDKAHPNIATFLELIPWKLRNRPAHEIAAYLEAERYVYLQFEVNTSLDSFMRRNECFSLYSKIFTLEQAAKGLLFLHKENIVHIDFKPANVFISKHCLAKIGDFGESLHLGSSIVYHNATTFPYAPPEVERHSQLSEKTDVYSFGVTLFECLFESNVKKPMQERYSLRKSSGNSYVELPYIQPERIKQYGNKRVISILSFLCLRCINVEAKQRPSMAWIVTILQHCRFYLELLYCK